MLSHLISRHAIFITWQQFHGRVGVILQQPLRFFAPSTIEVDENLDDLDIWQNATRENQRYINCFLPCFQ